MVDRVTKGTFPEKHVEAGRHLEMDYRFKGEIIVSLLFGTLRFLWCSSAEERGGGDYLRAAMSSDPETCVVCRLVMEQ